MKAKALGGLIFTSQNPEKLATFYKEVVGVPFKLQSHGNTPMHWECDYSNIHFAIIQGNTKDGNGVNIVPSFEVEDIEKFIEIHDLEIQDPIMDLGPAGSVAAAYDIDKNVIRLWSNT